MDPLVIVAYVIGLVMGVNSRRFLEIMGKRKYSLSAITDDKKQELKNFHDNIGEGTKEFKYKWMDKLYRKITGSK